MKPIIFSFLLAFFACGYSSCYFLQSSSARRYKQVEKIAPIDVAIIPGYPLKENGQWDTLLKSRIIWSVYLYRKGIVKNLIYSGGAVYSHFTEAKVMAQYAQALGIDPNHIFIDTIAEHSTENLYYGYLIARQHNFKTIAVATDPFQCFMLYKFSKKHFPQKIYFLPVLSTAIDTLMCAKVPAINLNGTISTNFVPISERSGYRERMSGTRGKHIHFSDSTIN